MKILISSIGSRGDVQPILALALALRAHGHDTRLCVAPNFKEWVESFGLQCIPAGPDLRKLGEKRAPSKPEKPSPAQLQHLAALTVRLQFRVLLAAARDCDVIVGGALQISTRSVAEAHGIPYVFAAYFPVTFPSPDHPPPHPERHYSQSLPTLVNRLLWIKETRRLNALLGATLNEERARVGLPPVDGVHPHMLTERPWLAADALLAPVPASIRLPIVQTGAWVLRDESPLPKELVSFLVRGEPPVYFGFGPMRATEQTARTLIEAARALGRRAILSRGWGNLQPIDAGTDCISIGDVSHEKLFPHVAAVVHHGGAGTTTAAARAGRAQVVIPHVYDQYYWAKRVRKLGVGVAGPAREHLGRRAMISALKESLRPHIAQRAMALSSRIQVNGAQIAAERLVSEFG